MYYFPPNAMVCVAVEAGTSDLLVAVLCSSLVVFIVVLLPCLLYLIYRRVHRVTLVKGNLTAIVTHPPSSPNSPNNGIFSELQDVSSGYSGSGSGMFCCCSLSDQS